MANDKDMGRMTIALAVIDGKPELVVFAPEDDWMDAPTRRYMFVRDIDKRLSVDAAVVLEDEGGSVPDHMRVKTFRELSALQRERVFSWLDAPDSVSVDETFVCGILTADVPPPPEESECVAMPAETVALISDALIDADECMEETYADGAQGAARKRRLNAALGGALAAKRGDYSAVAPNAGFAWGVTDDEITAAIARLGFDDGQYDHDEVVDAVSAELGEMNDMVSLAVARGCAAALGIKSGE